MRFLRFVAYLLLILLKSYSGVKKSDKSVDILLSRKRLLSLT